MIWDSRFGQAARIGCPVSNCGRISMIWDSRFGQAARIGSTISNCGRSPALEAPPACDLYLHISEAKWGAELSCCYGGFTPFHPSARSCELILCSIVSFAVSSHNRAPSPRRCKFIHTNQPSLLFSKTITRSSRLQTSNPSFIERTFAWERDVQG